MGTNFYLGNNFDQHIGKRSAAGLYCFDCGKTLCVNGESGIHDGQSSWLESCPSCKKTKFEETLSVSSGGIELGFNKDFTEKKTGVRSCCSFSWAMKPENFLSLPKETIVTNEYGDKFPLEEFLSMLKELCPIRFYHSVGMNFS